MSRAVCKTSAEKKKYREFATAIPAGSPFWKVEIDRMRHMNDSLSPIARCDTDSPQAVASTPSEPSTPSEGTRQGGCTLTDAEREAIEIAIPFLPDGPYTEYDGTPRPDRRATLRGLLERTAHTIK